MRNTVHLNAKQIAFDLAKNDVIMIYKLSGKEKRLSCLSTELNNF